MSSNGQNVSARKKGEYTKKNPYVHLFQKKVNIRKFAVCSPLLSNNNLTLYFR